MKITRIFTTSMCKYSAPAIIVALFFLINNSLKDLISSKKTNHSTLINVNNAFIKQQLNEGLKLRKMGKIYEEITLYQNMLASQQKLLPIYFNLGIASYINNEYAQAEVNFRKALLLKPNHPSILTYLGSTLRRINKTKEAIGYFIQAISIEPKNHVAHLELSKSYFDLKLYDEALKYGQVASKLAPHNVHTFLNLGHIYNKMGALDAAAQMYKKAVIIEPTLANAHYNLGYTLRIQGKQEEALKSLNTAISLNPNYAEAHLAKAQVLISMEKFEEGFEEFEWRWGIFGIDAMKYKNSMWDGSDIKGKTIILQFEQGLGDTLQYIRYAKLIKKKGAKVICKVQKPLIKILSSCPFIDKLITDINQSESYDTQANLMSLPRILHTTPSTIPAEIPYLYADPQLTDYWKQQLSKDTHFKVGICWNVDQIHEEPKSSWQFRFVSLKILAPLAKIKGVSFYSLQKTNEKNPLTQTPEGLIIHNFGPAFDEKSGSFMDSAAIIKNLDLVITVDTCIAHLAGALGKPVWMILPFSPDCRWYLDKAESPWYPTMKLFRQSKPGDWDTAIDEMKKELETKLCK